MPGIAIYILSSPQANLAHRINSSFSHLHSVFFYLAWFELPSGFQYSVLGAANLAAEQRDPQVVTQGLGHKSQVGLGWVCKRAGFVKGLGLQKSDLSQVLSHWWAAAG